MAYILAGDLGGTKTILALYEATGDGVALLREQRYASGSHQGLEEILSLFLEECPARPTEAAFGVAGPVLAGTARITNLGWLVEEEVLRQRFGLSSVTLLNDLVAIAYALPSLGSEELLVINAGRPDPRGTMAVVAPGTGLGEAYLCWDGNAHRPHPSEGGHADFAPVAIEERELLAFLLARQGHVSCESVCSGLGIANIYRYLVEGAGQSPSVSLREELVKATDPTPALLRHAVAGTCPLAVRAVRIFLRILAAEAGNVAIRLLATGGVFLGGGMLPRLLSVLDCDEFMARFSGKGRMAGILSSVPVHLILSEKAGLRGAALAALRGGSR